MKRAGALSSLLLPLLIPSACSLFAQQAVINTTPGTVIELPLSNASCPVSIRAQHGSGDGKNILLKNGQLPDIAQQLHLTFRNSSSSQVIGMQITVHGTGTRGGTVQAQADLSTSPTSTNQITKTLNLTLALSPKNEAPLDLSLRSFTSVSQVDLNAIRYADGSSWKSSNGEACHFLPEGIMLIGK